MNNKIKFVNLLIEHGANIHTVNTRGDCVLHLLIYTGKTTFYENKIPPKSKENFELLQFFLNAGVSPNTRNEEGHTPLFITAICADIAAMNLLVQSGANINEQDLAGRTPLMNLVHVIRNKIDNSSGFMFEKNLGDFDVIRETICTLVEQGADPHIKDNLGNNGLSYMIAALVVSKETYIPYFMVKWIKYESLLSGYYRFIDKETEETLRDTILRNTEDSLWCPRNIIKVADMIKENEKRVNNPPRRDRCIIS